MEGMTLVYDLRELDQLNALMITMRCVCIKAAELADGNLLYAGRFLEEAQLGKEVSMPHPLLPSFPASPPTITPFPLAGFVCCPSGSEGAWLVHVILRPQVDAIREAVREAIQIEDEMKAYAAALRAVSREYTPGAEPANFKALLDAKAEGILSASR